LIMAALRETTQVVVNPGRAVRHDRKRHTEGAVLSLGAVDVDFLLANGDVSLYVEPVAASADAAAPKLDDNVAAAIAAGQAGQDSTDTPALSPEQVGQALDNVAAAVASDGAGSGQADAAKADADQANANAEAAATKAKPAAKTAKAGKA